MVKSRESGWQALLGPALKTRSVVGLAWWNGWIGSGARASRSRRSSGERWMDGSGRRDGGWLGMDPEEDGGGGVEGWDKLPKV